MKNPIRAYITRIVRQEILAERRERNMEAVKYHATTPLYPHPDDVLEAQKIRIQRLRHTLGME